MLDMEGSSLITQLKAGSGIDMAQLATNLAAAQFSVRSEQLTGKSELLARQISAASEIRNQITLLAGALGERIRTGDLAARPVVTNGAVATAVPQPGATASGSYTLEVQRLASGQTLTSTPFAASTAAVGAGQITLRFGTTGSGSFTADAARAPVVIDIASGATLSDVAAAITASGAGVTAYVAQGTDGARLVMNGAQGALNGFTVEASEAPGEPGLAALAWNPAAGGDPALLKTQANDAAFLLDGVALTSASNRTATLAPGLALQLTGTNVGNPTSITVTDPTAAISTAMQDLVSALNEVATSLTNATDPESGDLARDGGARALQRALAGFAGQIIMPNAGQSGVRTLADLGLATERGGSFRLDTARLAATLERDPAGAAAMFTTGIYGVYASLDKIARNASVGTDPGSLAGSIARYQRMSSQVSEQTAALAEKQDALRSQLFARFSKTDVRISASQSTLAMLEAQIAAWNRSGD